MIVDTSILVALFDARDRRHPEVLAWYGGVRGVFVTTPLVVAEADHMVEARAGGLATQALYANLASGALEVAWWPDATATTLEVVADRPDVGLTDASLVALADRRGTHEIATLDEPHFRSLRPLSGDAPFRLLPADAD